MALDLLMKNGFQAISFEYVGVLDSYFIHRYVIIKYRSSSIMDKIHLLLLELWPFVNDNALFMRILQRGHPCPMDTFLVVCCFFLTFSLVLRLRPPDKSAIVELFFLFLIQNICCGYSKEPSQ